MGRRQRGTELYGLWERLFSDSEKGKSVFLCFCEDFLFSAAFKVFYMWYTLENGFKSVVIFELSQNTEASDALNAKGNVCGAYCIHACHFKNIYL